MARHLSLLALLVAIVALCATSSAYAAIVADSSTTCGAHNAGLDTCQPSNDAELLAGTPLLGYEEVFNLTAVPSRDEVMSCAQNWVDRKVPYCQCINNICCGSCPYCGTYRCDCSGYVAYCLKMSPGRNTNTLPQEAKAITKAELKKGDFVNCAGKHVVFFGGWTDSTKTKYVVYQEPGCSGTNKWAYKGVTTYPNGNNACYKPYRRNGLSATALKLDSNGNDVESMASEEDIKEAFMNTPYFAYANATQAAYEAEQIREHGRALGYTTF